MNTHTPTSAERVELIVHTPPGSGPDAMARALVEGLQEAGADTRAWEISHRAAGNGQEAMEALLGGRGRADLLSTCTPSFLQTPLLKGLTFSFRDLTPLARLVSDRYLLVAPSGSPFQSAETFASEVRSRPTRTGGYMVGSVNQLVAFAIRAAWNADVEFVITKSATDLEPALKEGRIDWGIGTPGEVIGGLNDGSLRALAVLAPVRLPRFPDVPPLASIGADIDITLWRGVMGPPGLSGEQRQDWDRILRAAVQSAAWRSYLERGALAEAYLDGAAFGELLERENAWYTQQLGQAGLLPSGSGLS